MPLELNRSDASFDAAFTGLLAAKRETQEDVQNAVAAILNDVRARGDAALLEYTARFDRVTGAIEPAPLRRFGQTGLRDVAEFGWRRILVAEMASIAPSNALRMSAAISPTRAAPASAPPADPTAMGITVSDSARRSR